MGWSARWRHGGGSDNDGPAHPTLQGLYAAYARQLELQPQSDRQGRMEGRNKSPLHCHLARALALREVALGPGHAAVGTSLDNLAALYQAQRRLLSHFSGAFWKYART